MNVMHPWTIQAYIDLKEKWLDWSLYKYQIMDE
jgi:hypothetical protein